MSAASFASWSTASFPFTLLWLNIQRIYRLHSVVFANFLRLLIRYCPEVDFGLEIASMIDWLSVYRDTLLNSR